MGGRSHPRWCWHLLHTGSSIGEASLTAQCTGHLVALANQTSDKWLPTVASIFISLLGLNLSLSYV